jgi:SAM-dependent methyltransferase
MSSPTDRSDSPGTDPVPGRVSGPTQADLPPAALEAFRRLPERAQGVTRRVIHRATIGGRVPFRWGGLRRTTPVNRFYGYGRGTPIDRWLMHRFIGEHRDAIRGDVLEVQKDEWATHYGGASVTRLDILDVNPVNSAATVIADLSDSESLGRSRYDCIIVPQTLQYVRDPVAAVRSLAAGLRPGGVVLLTVPTVSQIDLTCGPDGDRWRFTVAGVRSLLHAAGLADRSTVTAYGNVLVATAFLHGIAAEELTDAELLEIDERYPVLVCAWITS